MSIFRFKHFSVSDSFSAMKVGTDGVLLGAWMNIPAQCEKALDIGTGSGVIALMAAQRTSNTNSKPHIFAIDIDPPSVEEASANFQNSPWRERLSCIHSPLEEYFPPEKFDMIFTNPPFFDNSLEAPDARRNRARHTKSLSFDHLVEGVCRLLKEGGQLSIILPSEEGKIFIKKGIDAKLHLCRLCKVRTTPKKEPKRYLMEFVFGDTPVSKVEEQLLTIQEGSCFTEEYKNLTRDFYLF